MTSKGTNPKFTSPSSEQINSTQPMATSNAVITPLPKRSFLRAVRFASSSNDLTSIIVTVHTITSNNKREHTDIWYKRNEIESFKNDAKMLIHAIQIQMKRRKNNLSQIVPSKTLCSRGLEQWIDIERLRQKQYCIWVVLKVKKQLKSR